MNFICGQKESYYHKNYLFDDFPDKQTEISSSLEYRGWVALLLNGKVLDENSIRRNLSEVQQSWARKLNHPPGNDLDFVYYLP